MSGSQTFGAVFYFLDRSHLSLSYGNRRESKIEIMDIKDLTEMMHQFVRTKGWYAPDSLRPQTPRNLAISLSLEASEVLEQFQWQDRQKDKIALANELADVTLYLLQLASVSGIDLEQAVLKKLEENASRNWDPNTSNPIIQENPDD
jgi:NTP pyrophosphatase (non-canonical NTP hydrolase)